jgi:hypothetical protein
VTARKLGLRSSEMMSKSRPKVAPKNSHAAHLQSMSLAGIDPAHGVVTTIIGNHHGNHQGRQKSYGQYSRGSSQEYLATPPLPGDISKFVTVETDEYDAKRDSVDSLRPMPPPK